MNTTLSLSLRYRAFRTCAAVLLAVLVPWSVAFADEDILVNTGGNLPGLNFGGMVAPDDDILQATPPSDLNPKGGAMEIPDNAGQGGGAESLAASSTNRDNGRTDDDTLVGNPQQLPPLNTNGRTNSSDNQAASARNDSRDESLADSESYGSDSSQESEQEPCERGQAGGIFAAFSVAAQVLKPCPN